MSPSRSAYTGIAIMVAAMALFAVKDSFAKIIVIDITPMQLIWLQFAFTFAVLLAVTWPAHGWRAFRLTPLPWQLMRGLASVTGVGSLYWALSYIPLADACAMILTAPLVVTALSPLMLGERIGPRRIIAVVIGFVGVLLILRPGFRGELEGYLIAAMVGVLYGLNYIGNRKLGPMHPPLINYAHTVLPGTVVLAPAMLFIWADIPADKGLSLAGFLAFALISTGLMVTAFRFAPAAVIAPYQYTTIIFAAIAGYIVFGDFPDLWTWAGILLIVASGIYIALREGRVARSVATPQPAKAQASR